MPATRSPRRRRRGIALILVTAMVGAASVMALSVLSSNALQASATTGQGAVVQADALAESAMNRALYYVQNVDNAKCPLAVYNGTTYTETNQTLGSAVGGTFSLKVKGSGTYRWDVTATGVATGTVGSITRTLSATVEANYFGYGLAFGSGSPAIPASVSVTGDVYSPVAVTNSGAISGVLYGTSVVNSGTAFATRSSANLNATPVPAYAAANHYLLGYTFNSKAGTAAMLSSATLSNVTLGPTAANPAGVYYYTAGTAITLNGNVKINGTLIVNLAKLKVTGTGNAITAQVGTPAMPALVCDSDLVVTANNTALDVTGLTWLGTKITHSGGSGTGCQLTFTGAVLAYAGTAFDASIPTAITFNRARASVPGFYTGQARGPAPTSVTVVGWTN